MSKVLILNEVYDQMKNQDLLICTLEEKLRIATEAFNKIIEDVWLEQAVDIASEALSSIERCETGGRT